MATFEAEQADGDRRGKNARAIAAGFIVNRLISELRNALDRRFDKQEEHLDILAHKLDRLQQTLAELEYRSLSPAEKEERRFTNAQRLTLADVQQMRQGQTFHLMECSYHYPSEEAVVVSFEYRHDHLAADGTAHGFRRWESTEDWRPHKFLAGPDECQTSDHAGTVRRV